MATAIRAGVIYALIVFLIGFPAHGPWRMVENAIAARDVPVGQSWAFRQHRTMAEVIAKKKSLTA